MIIQISTAELLVDLQTKSEYETAGLEPEKRFHLQIGNDKKELVERFMLRASSDITNKLRRFMTPTYTAQANNAFSIPTNFEWTLSITERRTGCTVQALADACHAYIVNEVLKLYYESKDNADLAKFHSLAATDDMNTIDQLIYSKQPPIYSE